MPGDTLSASLEDYLEAIFHIVAEKQAARVKDIAARLSVNNSSVTGALHALAERGLINYAPYDIITLTDEGRREGREIVRRHEALRDFFVKVLDVESAEAEEAACRVEHAISRGILDRFVVFLNAIEVCPMMAARSGAGVGFPCADGPNREACVRCIQICLASLHEEANAPAGAPGGRLFLDGLAAGRKARVASMSKRSRAEARYQEMGLAPGAMLEVERPGEAGEPIEIKVNGYHVAIERRDAAEIAVEPF